MSTIFSTYVTQQIKEINHPALLQERKLNIDAADYDKYIKANKYKPYEKNKFNHVDNHKHWTALFLPLCNILQNKCNKIRALYHNY